MTSYYKKSILRKVNDVTDLVSMISCMTKMKPAFYKFSPLEIKIEPNISCKGIASKE